MENLNNELKKDTNEEFIPKEQAAGFPPFTRGYETFDFQTTYIEDNKMPSFDLELNKLSAQAIIEIFKEICVTKLSSKEVSILINIPFSEKMIVATKVLRTVFSIINLKTHNNPDFSKLKFYAKCNATDTLLLDLHFATASQIHYLVTPSDSTNWLEILPHAPAPIDPTYGNDYIETSVSKLVDEIEKNWQVL